MLEQAVLDELWDFGDPGASEQRLRDAAAQAGSPVLRAELDTQVARALGLQNRFDEADAVLDRIEQVAIAQVSPVVAARLALERGRVLNSSGHPTDAVALFHSAVDSARAAGSIFLEADALHMLAIADGDAAERWTREGLAALEQTLDARTRRWEVSLHNNLGWRRHDAGHPEGALSEFELALNAAQRYGTDDHRFAARWALARCLRSLGRNAEALVIQKQLATERPDDEDVLEELSILEP